MLKRASRALLQGAVKSIAKLPLTRRAMYQLSVAARGPAVVVFRARRLVPDTALGKSHVDRARGSAMTPRELERAIGSAQRTLEFLHVGQALSALASGARLPRGAALLTFDESFAATAELAIPVCRRLGVPMLMFATTGHLDGKSTLWDQEVSTLLELLAPESLSVPWIDRVLRTDTKKARLAALRRLLVLLASLDEERLFRRLDELRDKVGGHGARSGPPPQTPVGALDRMLTADELRSLGADPLVSFGAHGHHHLPWAAASDAALQEELLVPRRLLADLCGKAFADVVSYPYGKHPYFDERAILAAQQAGYRAAFTAEPGIARPGDHLFRLPRLDLGPRMNGVVAHELQGMSAAVDELLLVATGEEARLDPAPEG